MGTHCHAVQRKPSLHLNRFVAYPHMNKLWLGFAAIAAYGSIYPFDFQFQTLDPAAWQAFVDTCCRETSRGDILGNVVLFLPFGYLGTLAAGSNRGVIRQFIMVCVVGVIFAFLLQVAQLYLPTRDENLQDVIWNLLGIIVGAVLGIPSRHFIRRAADQASGLQLVPWILIGSWMAYRLIPFVPSVDFQSIKDSVKPLLEIGNLSLPSVAYTAVAWLVVGYLMDLGLRGKRLGRLLPLLVFGTFGLEILIVFNVLTPSNVAGGIIAIILHWAVFSRLRKVELPLLLCLLVSLAWSDLAPFILRVDPIAFNWLPFQGFLGGSMFVNAQSAAEKVFAYGSIVYLLLRMGAGGWISLLAATAWVAGIEFAQTYVVNHTPEITDPLLVIFAAVAIFAVESISRNGSQTQTQGHSSPQRRSLQHNDRSGDRDRSPRWVTSRVNLNTSQAELLELLAKEMNVSVSEASRKIVGDTIAEAGQDAPTPAHVRHRLGELILKGGASGLTTRENESSSWLAWDIELHPTQYDTLKELSSETGSTVSRLVRRIIDRFFSDLEYEANS